MEGTDTEQDRYRLRERERGEREEMKDRVEKTQRQNWEWRCVSINETWPCQQLCLLTYETIISLSQSSYWCLSLIAPARVCVCACVSQSERSGPWRLNHTKPIGFLSKMKWPICYSVFMCWLRGQNGFPSKWSTNFNQISITSAKESANQCVSISYCY